MVTQIINNGASLKIVTDNEPRFILKNQIKEVEIVRDTIIKLDIGQGALYNVFIDQLTVTEPATQSVAELRDMIAEMLQVSALAGTATEQLQIEGNAEIVNLKDSVNLLNEKLFFEPKLVDETNANVVYKGYSTPGAKQGDAVWSILKITNNKGILSYEWAKGSKLFDNVWNNRAALIYS